MKHHFPGTGPLRYSVGANAPQILKGAGEIAVPAGQTLSVDLASGGLWYGHSGAPGLPLPLNAAAVVNDAYAGDPPMWLCSAGYVLLAHPSQVLSVRLNADERGVMDLCCATADWRVQVFYGRTLPAAHAQALRQLGWPRPLPTGPEASGTPTAGTGSPGGKDCHWGIDNGLRSVVTGGLHLALLGHDVASAGVIPGSTKDGRDPRLTDDLLVRWTEVAAFFPRMQAADFPWHAAPATSAICRAFAQVHVALQPYLLVQATARQRPLLRPLWYDEPRRAELYTVNDAFQLGDDLLVYPVLDEGQIARDILLPPGLWRDAWSGEVLAGRLLQVPTPCPGLGLFVRRENHALAATLRPLLAGIARGSIRAGPGK